MRYRPSNQQTTKHWPAPRRLPLCSVLSAAALAAGMVAVVSTSVSATAQTCPGTGSPMTRIGDSVFDDANNNAIFDADESGLDGLVVELWLDADDDGTFEPNGDDGLAATCSVSTSGGGHFWFYDVDPDQYFIAVPLAPVGYESSTGSERTVAVDNVDDGDPLGAYASVTALLDLTIGLPTAELANDASNAEAAAETATAPATFADDDSDLTIDFGFAPVPCLGIGNRVWLDADGDGTHDADEVGIDGVTVQLFAADIAGDPAGVVVEATITSDGGYYLLDCHLEGSYVAVIPAVDFATGGVLHGTGSTADGSAGTDRRDAGLDPFAAGDQVVSRVVTLVRNGQPLAEQDKPMTTAWGFDTPSDAANNTTIDFGFVPLSPLDPAASSIGDFVWVDTDRDGVQDPSEAPVVGVTLLLFDSGGNQITFTVTDNGGRYAFSGLTAGEYSVCYLASTLPPGLVATTNGSGVSDDLDSDFDATTCSAPVTLGASMQLAALDLGLATSSVDLAITKAGTWASSSDTINWSIAVRNLGAQADPGSIIVTDILPAGLGTPTIGTPSGMSCNYDTATRAITCTSVAALPAGAALAINVTTPRTNDDLCSVSNTATVRGAAVDATTANNVATATVPTGCSAGASSTLPVTGGTVLLISLAAILTISGYQFLRLSDHHSARGEEARQG